MLHYHPKTTLTVRKTKQVEVKPPVTLNPFKKIFVHQQDLEKTSRLWHNIRIMYIWLWFFKQQTAEMYLEFIYGKYYSKQMVDNSKQWFFHYLFFWNRNKKFQSVQGWCDYCWHPRGGLPHTSTDAIQSQSWVSSMKETNIKKDRASNRLDFS